LSALRDAIRQNSRTEHSDALRRDETARSHDSDDE